MTKSFRVAATLIAIAAGAPIATDAASAADATTAIGTAVTTDIAAAATEGGSRKILVEPQGSGNTTFIVVDPEGIGSETGGETVIPPIAVEPEGSATPGPVAGTDKVPTIRVEPEPFRPAPIVEPQIVEPQIAQSGFVEPQISVNPGFDRIADKAPVVEVPTAPTAPADPNAGARALYDQLIANGYAVDILQRDQYGRLVFDVTDGSETGYVMLVDAAEGTIYEQRQYRTTTAQTYSEPAPRHTDYTPRVRYNTAPDAGHCGTATAYRY